MTLEHRPQAAPPAAIELSRRKAGGRRKADTAAKGHAAVEGRTERAHRVTAVGIVAARLGRARLARVGALVLAALALVAVFADLLASDLPLVCRWQGTLYVLPCVTHPPALSSADMGRDIRAAQAAPGDWAVPTLAPYGPAAVRTDGEPDRLVGPLAHGHPFGTDAHGRDVFARVVHGTRSALGSGLAAAAVVVALGIVLGAVAAFSGGLVDSAITRAVESLTSIPTLLLVLAVGAFSERAPTTAIVVTIALTRWTELARLVRAEVLTALGADYVTAARALGATASRILWRHVLPNVLAPALVAGAFSLAWVVQIEATVDFLHPAFVDHSVGAAATWGEVLGEARAHPGAWWLIVFPGAALLTTLLAIYVLAEAARDAVDPRLRGAP